MNYDHELLIPWIKEGRPDWNEVCIWAIEQFGLPGDRYQTQVTVDAMTFRFRNPRDLVWMKLRWT